MTFNLKSLCCFCSVMIMLCVAPVSASTQAKAGDPVPLQVEKWEVLDIDLVTQATTQNPFVAQVNAYFTHQATGKKQTVPIVFNGEHHWLLRFSAAQIGDWHYQIEGDVPELNGVKGLVQVVANDDPSNHGAMVLSPDNKQAFAYEDGSEYFLLGYELDWLFALDYSNDKDTPKSEHLLSRIKEHGFNHVVMNVYAHDVSWQKDPKLAAHPEHEFGGRQDIYPFLGSNEHPDFSGLNVAFFQKLDRSIQLLHDKRMVSHLMIYVWNKMVSWPDMNSDADNMYFDYVVKRYQAFPNIVWDISKEALFYGRADEAYIKGRIERLRSMNHFNRLVTVHDFNYCAKYPEQVDFISTQDWGYDIYNRMLNVRKRFADKVIYNIEHGGYESAPYEVFPGDYTDPEVVLRRNWLTIFAGVYSTYYWQANAWNVIIYNPFEQVDPSAHPKFSYFSAMAAFFERFTFSSFTPVPGKNGSGYTMVDEQDTYLIYVSKDNFQMSRGNWYLMPEGKEPNRTMQWFNTLTGEMTEASDIEKGQLFISPWRGSADAILISQVVE